MNRLLRWVAPDTLIYWLDRSGDLTWDMVQALMGVRRAIWREMGQEPPPPPVGWERWA